VRELVRASFTGGAKQLAFHARKPRRDRTRRGAGSETREVSGPRAYDDSIRWKGARARGCASLNQKRDCDPGFVGQMTRAPPGGRDSAGDADGPRVGACGVTKALRGRCDSVKALPAMCSQRGMVRRVGIPGAVAPRIAERASATRRRSNAPSRGGREPGGVRRRNAPGLQRLKWATV